MATEEQLIEALKRADAAGNTEDAQAIANAIKEMRAQNAQPEPSQLAQKEKSLGRKLIDLSGDVATFGAGDTLAKPFQAAADALGGVEDAAFGAIPSSRADAEKYFTPRNVASAALATPVTLARGTAQFAADLLEDPVPTAADAVKSVVTSPVRAVQGFRDSGRAAQEGDTRRQIQRFGEGLAATSELGLVAAPVAGRIGARTAEAATQTAIPKPQRVAVERLMEADPNLEAAAQNAKRLQAEGVPATTADLVSRNAQSRLKGAARRDGPAQDLAQDAFDPRQADQSARLTRTIEDAFGVEGDFLDTVKGISEAKRAEAAPLYEAAHATPTQLTPRLVELVNRPPLQQALREAESLAAIDGVTLKKVPGNVPAVQVRTPSGATRLEGDTARLHYMRQALDDQIDAFRDKTTGKLSNAPRAQALVRLRKQFNEAIREANPEFAKADAVWSEGTAAEQAMERGVKAASMRTERQVRQLMDDAIREGDQEFFELGFAQGMIEKVGGSGSDMANRTLRLLSPENQKITKTVLGDERGEALLNRLRVENLMSRTRNRISPNVGSDTAENVQQSAAQAVSIFADVMSGNVVRAGAQGLRIAGQKKLSERMIRTQQEVDAQLIRLATENPEELLRLIQEVNAERAPKPMQLPDLRGLSGATAASGATDSQRRQQATLPPQ